MWEDSYGFPAFHSLIFNIVSEDFVTRYQTKVSKPVHKAMYCVELKLKVAVYTSRSSDA